VAIKTGTLEQGQFAQQPVLNFEPVVGVESLDDTLFNAGVDIVAVEPITAESGDLLAQLKVDGTIKAGVIKVLQGKLLLSSRLDSPGETGLTARPTR
jgi:hypothetical protein